MEVSAFITEQLKGQLKEQRHHDERMRREMSKQAKADQAELEAKIEQLTPRSPAAAVSEAQLEALQTRLQSLHEAELLDDDLMFALEDVVADFIEGKSAVVAPVDLAVAADKVSKLVGLSQGMPVDAMFARQAKRKFARR